LPRFTFCSLRPYIRPASFSPAAWCVSTFEEMVEGSQE
jgi:hypothetical protein